MRPPRRFRRSATAIAFAVAGLFIVEAAAHPHVWITVRCAFVFDEAGRVVGLVETWAFDEMYSALAVMGVKRDERANAAALRPLAASIVAGSRSEAEYTAITVAGEAVPRSEPQDVGGEWSGNGLSVKFRLKFATPLRPEPGRPLRVEVRDPDLYADFRLDRTLQAAGLPPGCAVRLDDPEASLPSDPEARSEALINGPLLTMTVGVELNCGP